MMNYVIDSTYTKLGLVQQFLQKVTRIEKTNSVIQKEDVNKISGKCIVLMWTETFEQEDLDVQIYLDQIMDVLKTAGQTRNNSVKQECKKSLSRVVEVKEVCEQRVEVYGFCLPVGHRHDDIYIEIKMHKEN